jgi:hypothetical protein
MVAFLMAHLKYLSLHIFLRYFEHSNRIPCVSMDPYSKNHVETGKFPYGFCIIMVIQQLLLTISKNNNKTV